MPFKPFDNLPAVNTLIRLYKEGYSTSQLARYFDTHKGMCLKCLRMSNVPIRSSYINHAKIDPEFEKKRYTDQFKKTEVVVTPHTFEKGKYDDLLEEPVNNGHDYDYILKKQGCKRPKSLSEGGGFGRIRQFKRKETPQ